MDENTVPLRYRDRKTHSCGCVTVWDILGTGVRYEQGCNTHRHHAERWLVTRII